VAVEDDAAADKRADEQIEEVGMLRGIAEYQFGGAAAVASLQK